MVQMIDAEIRKQQEKEHFDTFDAHAKRMGIERIKRHILSSISKAEIENALIYDRYMNGRIPLERWDRLAGAANRYSDGVAPYSWCPVRWNGSSLSDGVCTLKHVARHYIATGEGEQIYKTLKDGDIIPPKYQYLEDEIWKDGELAAGKVWKEWSYNPIRMLVFV